MESRPCGLELRDDQILTNAPGIRESSTRCKMPSVAKIGMFDKENTTSLVSDGTSLIVIFDDFNVGSVSFPEIFWACWNHVVAQKSIFRKKSRKKSKMQ